MQSFKLLEPCMHTAVQCTLLAVGDTYKIDDYAKHTHHFVIMIYYNTIQYSFISAQHICSVHVMSNIVVDIKY